MQFFQKVREWGRKVMDRTASTTGIAREYKTVFELGNVPAFQQFYDFGIYVWKWIYKGFYRAWHVIDCPTIANPRAKRELFRMNAAKAICAEMAGLVWGEECEINVSIEGRESTDENPDPLNEFVQKVLCDNAFREKMQESIEQGCALGGSALKVWRDIRHDSNGNEVPGTDNIRIGYAMADQFVPISWDNAQVHEGVFISRVAKKADQYGEAIIFKNNRPKYRLIDLAHRLKNRI